MALIVSCLCMLFVNAFGGEREEDQSWLVLLSKRVTCLSLWRKPLDPSPGVNVQYYCRRVSDEIIFTDNEGFLTIVIPHTVQPTETCMIESCFQRKLTQDGVLSNQKTGRITSYVNGKECFYNAYIGDQLQKDGFLFVPRKDVRPEASCSYSYNQELFTITKFLNFSENGVFFVRIFVQYGCLSTPAIGWGTKDRATDHEQFCAFTKLPFLGQKKAWCAVVDEHR